MPIQPHSHRKSRAKKIRRLRAGDQPRVLDLFAGCGGLSLGFHLNGFQIGASVELDPLAAATHWRNFHGSLGNRRPEDLAKDITEQDAEDLVYEFACGKPPEEAVGVIIGGPPCQAFARVCQGKVEMSPRWQSRNVPFGPSW